MAGTSAGDLFVTFSMRDKGFEKSLKDVQRRLTSISATALSVGKSLAAIGTATVVGFVPAIKAASDFQEAFSKFETVFGDQSQAMRQFANELARQLGRSELQIVHFLASAQDLFVPIGFDADSATALSKTITGLAIDLASFNNVADSKALEDLQAAILGSGEVMKKYGVVLNETTTKQKLFDEGIEPKNASELQKVLARLNIILESTQAAQGDAIRTGDSFANQYKRLTGEITNTAVAVGAQLLPAVTRIVKLLSAAAAGVAVFTQRNETGVVTTVALGAALTATGLAAIAVGVIIGKLNATLGVLSVASGVASAAMGLLGSALIALTGSVYGAVFLAGPILVIVAAIALATAAMVDFGRISEDVANVFDNTWSGIAGRLQSGDIVGAFSVIMRGVGAVIYAGLEEIFKAFGELLAYIPLIGNALQSLSNSVAGYFDNFGEGLEKAVERASNEAKYAERQRQANADSQPNDLPNLRDLQAISSLEEQRRILSQLEAEGKSVYDSTRTAQEKYANEVERLNELYRAQVIDVETLKRAHAAARTELEQQSPAYIKHQQLLSEASRVIDETRTAEEQHATTQKKLAELLKRGLIDRETYNRAIENSQAALDSQNSDLQLSNRIWDETATAAERYQQKLDDIARLLDKGLLDPETARRARLDAEQQLLLSQAQDTAQDVSRIPTVDGIFGGSRAGQIFGANDYIQKQQLDVQKKQLDEQKKTNEFLKASALAFG